MDFENVSIKDGDRLLSGTARLEFRPNFMPGPNWRGVVIVPDDILLVVGHAYRVNFLVNGETMEGDVEIVGNLEAPNDRRFNFVGAQAE